MRTEQSAEAIRLTRIVHRLLPEDGEVAGLLALMVLTGARRPARTGPDGTVVPMAEQDRGRWDTAAIAEGVALITEALPRGPVGPYQIQAAVAAVHGEAPSAEATDWPQIRALYEVLLQITDTPLVRLNHAVAVSMVDGPRAGLELIDELPLEGDHRLYTVRAHLLESAGDPGGAHAAYLTAARLTASVPQQRYLHARAARL